LAHFIYGKISIQKNSISFNEEIKNISLTGITTKTLAFTYLNPHVYSDTVFFLGNFSKNLLMIDKYYFGIGASIASFLFFFVIGYLSKLLSKYLQSAMIWKRINLFIIIFMSIIAFYVLIEIIKFF
jgi:L-lysine exporter family protein LysE/ArgO